MESETFRTGKFAGVPLHEVPKQYLEWAYVNLDAMSPRTRMLTGVMLANWVGNIRVAADRPVLPTKSLAPTVRAVQPQRQPVRPNLAEELFAVLEYYAGGQDGEMAREVLTRLCAKK